MSYMHILVAVAATPESHQLLAKAVSIARPVNARISLVTLVSDPELYNQFAAPMLEDLREVMQEETLNLSINSPSRRSTPLSIPLLPMGHSTNIYWISAANTPSISSFMATIITASFREHPARRKAWSAPARSMCCWCRWQAINGHILVVRPI